jgi:ribonuclease HI
MPKKTKKKKPIISTNEKIARERERYLEGEKEFRRKERERSERINQQIKETIKSVGSGIKKFAVKTLSGARGDAMRKRARELEKTIYPNRFIRRK